MPESRFPLIIYPALLIACLCIYGIILQPGMTFGGMDFLNLGYPRVALAHDALADGKLPLWNWYEWGGAPLLATLLGALLYPPTWVVMLLPLPYGLQLFTFAHLLWGGIGAAYAGRRILGFSPLPAAFCGIVFMGNAFWPGRVEQFQVIAVNSMLPWLTLALHSTLAGRRGVVWLPITWCFTLLAGHPQFAAFNLLAACFITGIPYVISAASGLQAKDKSLMASIKPVLVAAAGGLLGTCMAAVQLFPTWELGQLSERIWPYDQPTVPQLEWSHLSALIVPGYYNTLTGQHGRVFGFTEMGVYAGLITVPLAVLGLFAGLRASAHRRAIIVVASAWLLAIAFALGTNGLVAPLFFDHVPFFNQSRGAARSLNVASFSLALLAGYGVAAIQITSFSQRYSRRLLPYGLAIILTFDLAVNHYAELKEILVPTAVLDVRPLVPADTRSRLQADSHRIYRFMASDSDLYLNNSAGAVAERVLRIQPNLNSLAEQALVDGYEEGLLPTRNMANLFRRYNRNLRNDSPDPALLAFLGSNLIISEFPLPANSTWEQIGPTIQRPPIVPPIMGQAASYRFYKSRYVPARLLDPSLLFNSQQALDRFRTASAHAFPVNARLRASTGKDLALHPLAQIKPEDMAAGAASYTSVSSFKQWNRLTASVQPGTTQTLVLMPSYPGWKAKSEKHNDLLLKYLSSIFYMVESPVKDEVYKELTLTFSPFSVRSGFFVSLVAGLCYLYLIIVRQITASSLRNHKMDKL